MYHEEIGIDPVPDFDLEVDEDNYWNIVIKSIQNYLV